MDDPCAECGGMCCSFREMRIVYLAVPEGMTYVEMLEENDHTDELLLADGSVPEMDWYLVDIEDGREGLAFECRHLEDGRCGVYDERPEMCRKFECPVLEGDMGLDEFVEARSRDPGEVDAMNPCDVTAEVRAVLEEIGGQREKVLNSPDGDVPL